MDLFRFLKILLGATLLLTAAYGTFNWMFQKFHVRDQKIRYVSDEEDLTIEDQEVLPPLQDCYRFLDPTVIEMCLEESAKKFKAQDQ